jgi:hypothetical protein
VKALREGSETFVFASWRAEASPKPQKFFFSRREKPAAGLSSTELSEGVLKYRSRISQAF